MGFEVAALFERLIALKVGTLELLSAVVAGLDAGFKSLLIWKNTIKNSKSTIY